MSNPIEVLKSEWPVIVQAPWSFALALLVIAGVIFWAVRSLKSQEIADLSSRLTLRNDEISDYQRKLSGASPDEAKQRLDNLEAQVRRLQPKRLDPSQRDLLRDAAASAPGIISITADVAAADARFLVADFSAAFQEAGWDVQNPMVMGLSNPPRCGISVSVSSIASMNLVQKNIISSLRQCGVDFELREGLGQFPHSAKMPLSMDILVTTPSI